MHIRQGTITFDRYRAVDAATGEEIPDVIEADDGEGWIRVLRKHGNGRPILSENGEQKRLRRHAAIRIERKPEEPVKRAKSAESKSADEA